MKKAWFLGLCLLNIVFFFWEFRKGPVNPSTEKHIVLPTIMLVEELEKAQRGAAISAYLDEEATKLQRLHVEKVLEKPIAMMRATKPKSVLRPVSPNQPTVCQEIGPFEDLQKARQWLAGRGLQGQVFDKEAFTPLDYQVYYPPAKSAEQTRIQKLMLNAKGISDIWLIPSGELKGAFSLGVFSDQARAVLFKNQLAERGVKAEIMARQKSQQRFFVKIRSEQKVLPTRTEGLSSTVCGK